MNSLTNIILKALVRPFKGTSKESGFALPMAIGATMAAGFGIVYVGNRVDDAEELMNRQLASQAARMVYDQLAQASASAISLKASSKVSGGLNAPLANCISTTANRAACTSHSGKMSVNTIVNSNCDTPDAAKRKTCLSSVFSGADIKISQLSTLHANELKLYSSAAYFSGNKEENLLSGPYTRYGAKCPISQIGKDGCGRIFVRTSFAVKCENNNCTNADYNPVEKLVVTYAVYTRQPNGESYAPIAMGYGEPAIASCPTGYYLFKINPKAVGEESFVCNKLDIDAAASYPITGDTGAAGPTGYTGPRGPRGPRY